MRPKDIIRRRAQTARERYAAIMKEAEQIQQQEILTALKAPAVKLVNLLHNRVAQLQDEAELNDALDFHELELAEKTSNSAWGMF
jgi:hypothetical protein